MAMTEFGRTMLGAMALLGLLVGLVACKEDPPPAPTANPKVATANDWHGMTEAWEAEDPIPPYR